MRVLLGVLGGITGLVLFFVAFLSYWIHRVPKGTSVGISPSLLIRPPFLLWELLSFAIGFMLAHRVSRSRG
jgi:hypothetical protein